MADIFLSYARADQDEVERIAAALEEAGYSLWWDREIRGGKQFSKDIEQAIDAAKAVIVVWSKHSVESEWVRDEAAFARDADKMVPVQLDATLPPLGYRQRQAIDLSHGMGEQAMAHLARALDPMIGGETHHMHAAPGMGRTKKMALMAIPLVALAGAGGWWLLEGGLAGDAEKVVAEEPHNAHVAVLPFEALSSGEEDRFFAEGLSEEIINRLSPLPELVVISRTSSFFFKGKDVPLKDIAQRLGATHLVEGTVRRGGDLLRVTARLVKASDLSEVWSKSYDVAPGDMLAVQSDIATSAAEALDVLLDENKRKRMAEEGTDDPEVYTMLAKANDLYLNTHAKGIDMNDLAAANLLYDKAFETDPSLWIARWRSSDRAMHDVQNSVVAPTPVDDAKVRAMLAEYDRRMADAIRAAPTWALPILRQSRMIASDDWTGAVELTRLRLTKAPACPSEGWPEFLAWRSGLGDEVVDFYGRVAKCDPLESDFFYAQVLLLNGQFEESIKVSDRAIANEEWRAAGTFLKAVALIGLGRTQEAEALAPDALFNRTVRLLIASYRGDREAARALAPGPDANLGDRLNYAALTGDREAANRIAAQIDARPGGPTWIEGYGTMCFCGEKFDLDATPNYKRLLEQAGAMQPLPKPFPLKLKPW
ncbi:TIR domain-containing protein [Sphingomicrobium nitratireducens]|uniref:TIR domain-containing protein n=1 Tax=Sphingomicrobium nitratireducens TaxID=2964666 RepID=UPI00223F7B40|nr:TIR domain-containing protein [Sphingomicrobium nitratireducens]